MNCVSERAVLSAAREGFPVADNFISEALSVMGDLETEVWLGLNITDESVTAELKALGLTPRPNPPDGEIDQWPIVQRHFAAGQWERKATDAGLMAPATPFDMVLG